MLFYALDQILPLCLYNFPRNGFYIFIWTMKIAKLLIWEVTRKYVVKRFYKLSNKVLSTSLCYTIISDILHHFIQLEFF